MMIDVSRHISALMPSTAKRYEMPSEGTSANSSVNWKPAAARSYAQYTHSEATSEMVAPMSEVQRTSSGRVRATNMTTRPATNGAQVMIERIGSSVMLTERFGIWDLRFGI